MSLRTAAILALACSLSSARLLRTDNGFNATEFLRAYAGFSKQDIERAASGASVARSLPAEGDEVAAAATVFMSIPRATYVERFRDIASFKRNPAVLAIGRFSVPPVPADMQGLMLNDDDLSALRRCRPSDCGMRLDAAGMTRVSAAGLQGPGAEERGSVALRAHLASYAAEYLKQGDAMLMKYQDRSRPRSIRDDLAPIIQRSPYFQRELSSMRGDVASFKGIDASANEHLVYWSVEKIASTPVISLTHAIIGKPSSNLTAIATRQIYGSHFFHASLGLTLLADTSGPNGPGVTVIYMNRSRVDAFGGLLGPVKRTAVRSRARGTTEKLLRDLKTKLERK